MEGTSRDDYDASGKGSHDASGKGVMFAKPVAPEGTAAKNAGSLKPNGGLWNGNQAMTNTNQNEQPTQNESVEFDISDLVEALFEGQQLSDEFKQKASVIFETALNQKVSVIEEAILQASQEVIEEEVASAVGVLTEKVDDYLGYVINEWMDENKLQVEQGFRTEIAENFILGLKELFESNYIEVPEEKIDLVDELFAENRQLEESLNELMKKNIELAEQNLVNECATVFLETSAGLADTEVEKLASLSEGIEFQDVETYKNKLSVLKESYFGANATPKQDNLNSGMINEEVSSSPVTNDEMSMYVNSISKHLKSAVKR
jgi:hypothetical protein